MISFILSFGLLNLIGGRSKDIFGELKIRGALLFRCILPAIVTGLYSQSLIAFLAVLTGSAIWCVFGWSFDEITGDYDPGKYHNWVKRIGLNLIPLDGEESSNKKRGVIMKGVRGGYDITLILLSFINPFAILLYPANFLMGAVYWVCGKLSPRLAVPLAELIWGAVRGALIGGVI